ncbi:hypothetical protein ACUYFE_05850 [Olegusella massiliensis]|uniref:hypothetical protein n=1 Tax=Olegusella massiliensis TaxID=1776381 RepID=UPI0003AE7407|nr:hypothetical protein [Olegusella massiliensis]ERL13066.1 hypothetical protein HMPREF1248_1299 [Coriobacteriaceae bacterium BV3Ac1]
MAFELGTPSLICRWRLANGGLPLENRHLRAFSQRGVDPALVSWAKQHIEWTLSDGAAGNPDGVLMVVVDEEGQAAMSVGPYKALGDTSINALLQRAMQAQTEASRTGVAPETLWAVTAGQITSYLDPAEKLAGASSLVSDLMVAHHLQFTYEAQISDAQALAAADEVFLVSDEHGVVAAAGKLGKYAKQMVADYQKLLASFS